MTTTDLPRPLGFSAEPPHEHPPATETVAALRKMIFGAHWPLHRRIRDIVADLGDVPLSGRTYRQETQIAPGLLRAVISRIGLPASRIATDPQLRGALCDWAQVAAPRLLLILTGHFDLAIGAILKLGNGSRYQQDALAELETAKALGLLALTELGGTNGNNQQTIAVWDASTDGFWLISPTAESWKFMPNAADESELKTAVVTARLIVDGADEGVLPFLLKLRTAAGLAKGVRVKALPDKASAPMDHGLFCFDHVWVPRDALLGGDLARMTEDGRFECAVPVRHRFSSVISVLTEGRLDLANASIAGARAALKAVVTYAEQRQPEGSTRMADRDSVTQDQVDAVAAVYATGAFGRQLRDVRPASTLADPHRGLKSMLAKPLLSDTARDVLSICSDRLGAQGDLRSNLLPDLGGNTKAIRTAEGDNRIMLCQAGKSPDKLMALQIPGTPAQQPWYITMLVEREHRIAAGIASGSYDPASAALGPESAAAEMAEATAQRLGATALLVDALAITEPTARHIATSAAAAYALKCIYQAAAWFISHDDMPRVAPELKLYRQILAGHLQTMVAAFEIPVLPAPIFAEDYIQWYRDYTGWGDVSVSGHGRTEAATSQQRTRLWH